MPDLKMDLPTLAGLFTNTYNADPNVRKAAELQIRKIGTQEGVISALLQIIASDGVEGSTRQACAVWLKNRVQFSYALQEAVPGSVDRVPISPPDRDALRGSILRLLAASPSRAMTVQLSSVLKGIIAVDYPEKWPSVTDEIKALLNSGDIREVGAGCVASLEAVRAFRYRQEADYLPQIVERLFPTLVQIATSMLQTPPSTSQEIPTMLHLIVKAYRTSIIVNLSKHQQSSDSLVPWGRLFMHMVKLQIPNEVVPQDEEERERSEWWKAKKWTYATLGRLFHRFGNPSQLPSPMLKDYKNFAQHFVTHFAPEIFTIYLQQVELYVSGQAWLSKKCQYNVFTFFTECVKPKSTWNLLKPHFNTLVSSFVFPQLCFNQAKKELWDNDPVEYVRSTIDEYENFATPASAATSLLFSLASNRTKVTFMPILEVINNVLRSSSSPAERFGALNMTAALGPFIMKHPDVGKNMENFMMQYVLPAFSAPEPYLRAVACEVVGTVEKTGMQWRSEENLNSHFRAVAAALDDTNLPVRVHAILALTELISTHESVKSIVAPQIGKVIQDLLKLTDETDLDILNASMETMVEYFQEELLPVAADLASRLCETYMRLVRESAAQEAPDVNDVDAIVAGDLDDDKIYAAMGTAKTIATVINSIDSSPDILNQVREVVVPIIGYTLENKLIDLFDQVYELTDSLTFRLHNISSSLWPIFELTYKLFKGEAIDFLEEMLPSLDNFISYGTETFKNRPDYRQMVLDIFVTTMTSDHLGSNDRVNGCLLAESLLLNLRGSADETLHPLITTAYAHLDKTQTSVESLATLEVLINAILYNAPAALQIMESTNPGSARVFFDRWFAAITSEKQALKRVHDKKLSILALCALLEIPPASVPESLQDGWSSIVGGILQIFKDLPAAIQARREKEEMALDEALEDDEDLDDNNLLNLNEDDEDVWDEDSAYLELLAQQSAKLREKAQAEEDGESIGSSSEDLEEDLGYFSPLDNVDPYVSFKHALTTFQMQNGNSYMASTTSLSTEHQALLMEVMRIAESKASAPPAST